jgi:predicted negative regulator of RcsB-dependent stress response
MAILESDDSNIIDGKEINLRVIVYPILAAAVIIVGGFGYYYYQQNQREMAEADARAALLKATTPEEMIAVADKYPHTDQATMALMKAADVSYDKLDYSSSLKDYQRILDTARTDPLLRQSAQLGLASALEASGKVDDALNAYLEVARLGDKSPYAPFGYNAAARIYSERGDKENEKKLLVEETNLDPDSAFVKEAQSKLNQMNSIVLPGANGSTPAPAAPIMPMPAVPPAKS